MSSGGECVADGADGEQTPRWNGEAKKRGAKKEKEREKKKNIRQDLIAETADLY